MNTEQNTQEKKVPTAVAMKELTEFLKIHKKKEFRRGKMTSDKIAEDYIDVLEAIEDGNLVFVNNKPTYTLRDPLFAEAEDTSLHVTKVEFRTRIKEADRTEVMNGLNLEKERGTYVLKTLSYISKLSMIEVKKLEKDDFDVLNQICSVF